MPTRGYLPAAAIAAAFSFVLLARWVIAGQSMPFDMAIRDTVHSWAAPFSTAVLYGITMLGTEWLMLPLGALAVWRLVAVHRRREAIRLAAGTLGAELASALLKFALRRPRPSVFFGFAAATTESFPSGHAFVGTVFYGLLAAILIGNFPFQRARIVGVTMVTVLLIGLSRVYLGYHYPTDVLGGWLCAAVWLAMARFWRSGSARVNATGKAQEESH